MAEWSKTAVFTYSSIEESCLDSGWNLAWDYDIDPSELEITCSRAPGRLAPGDLFFLPIEQLQDALSVPLFLVPLALKGFVTPHFC